MLRLEGVSVAYGKHEALHDGVAQRDGRARRPPSWARTAPARRRCSTRSSASCDPRPGGRILFEGRPIESEPTHRIVESRRRAGPGGPPPVRRDDRGRESRAWAPTPGARAAARPRDDGTAARAVSRAGRAAEPAGRYPERRRAADAGDRAGPDVGVRSCCSSTSPRSVSARAWPRSCSRPCAPSPAAGSRCCWSSRTCITASDWRIESTCWKTAGSSAPGHRRSSDKTRRSSRPISGSDGASSRRTRLAQPVWSRPDMGGRGDHPDGLSLRGPAAVCNPPILMLLASELTARV